MSSPTMRDVAQLAGVSIKTVSNVVNEYVHVRDETRSRVLTALDQLGYQLNFSARGLRSGRTGVIGLVIPELRQSYFAELADSIIRAAEQRGLGVMVEQSGKNHAREVEILSGQKVRLTDGLLFSPARLVQEDLDRIDVDYPLVLLGERMLRGATDHVTMHNESAARAAVEHLLQRGRRRIAIVGAEPDGMEQIPSSRLRLRGYRSAMVSAGIALDPALIRIAKPWHRETGEDATRQLLDDRVDFDGIFALNDSLALGVLRALGEAGVRVPDDVAVIGFDNIDEARFSVPSLTSVDPGRDLIAATAVDYLTERINMKDEEQVPPRLYKSPFHIVERESTRS